MRRREHVPDALGSALDGATHGDAAAGIDAGGAGDQGLPEEVGGLLQRRRGHRRSLCLVVIDLVSPVSTPQHSGHWSVRKWWWWEWPVQGGDLYTAG
jgi:hypothetical protein